MEAALDGLAAHVEAHLDRRWDHRPMRRDEQGQPRPIRAISSQSAMRNSFSARRMSAAVRRAAPARAHQLHPRQPCRYRTESGQRQAERAGHGRLGQPALGERWRWAITR